MSVTGTTLGAHLRRYARFFLAGALALLLTNGLAFAIPKVIGWFIDGLNPAASPARGTRALAGVPLLGPVLAWVRAQAEAAQAAIGGATRAAPYLVALVVIGLATGAGLMRVVSRVCLFHAGRRIEYDLRRAFFARLMALSPSYFRRTPTGDLLSRATNDLTAVRVVFGPGVLNVVNTAVVYLVGVSLLVRIDAMLALYALLPYPVVLLFTRRVTRHIYDYSSEVQTRLGELSQRAQETLTAMQVVQMYGREEERTRVYADAGGAYVAANMKLTRARGVIAPLVGLIGGAGLLVTLWLGGKRVVEGALTLGQFVEFQGYVAMLAWPTLALGWVMSLWQRGRAALDRVNEVLAEPPTLADPPPDRLLPAPAAFSGDLSVRGLTVGRGGDPILHDIHLEVPAGTHLGVIGPTGSGKSTLAEALARLLEVPPGTVYIDGLDVTRLPVGAVRLAIGYAQQEPFLFSSSLRDNLTLGRDPGGEERLQEVVEAVQLAQDLQSFPAGLDTEVGERGVQLSGGQKQRVALGRALLGRPALLILDDALSAVDAGTEARILAALRRLLKGRTAVIVSHRVAAVQGAQQIIVLAHGRIAERGSHEELLGQGGLYARLALLQQLREELEGEPVPEEAA